ncbi:MAG: general secretion pathway protein GspK [Geminicoccales bacterium]
MRFRASLPDLASSRGMALIAVLWIVSLLALLAAGIGSSSRVSSQLAFNALDNTKAKFLAEAGINRVIYRLLRRDVFPAPLIDGSSSFSFRMEEGAVAVQIQDEDGKIDLNFATVELLAGLIEHVGLEGNDVARAMAEKIVDYRDSDQTPLPAGAESPTYAAAGKARGAADRPFRQVEELTSVLGMTDALYERLRHHVTVFAEAEGFDPLRASDAALRALPGIDAEALSLIRAGNGDTLSILPDKVSETLEDYVLISRDMVFELRALGQTRGGGLFLRSAVIALDGGRGRKPFTTFRWRRGTLTDADPLLPLMNRLAPSL